MFIPYKISEPTMLDHNKQRVGEGLPERKPGGNCIWQRPICPSWTFESYGRILRLWACTALSQHETLYLNRLIFSSVQNYSYKNEFKYIFF